MVVRLPRPRRQHRTRSGLRRVSWTGFAADALAVVDHLGVAGDPALLACGHSKGATALLLGEVERPATYLRVWAYEPIMFPTETLHLTADDFPLAGNARRRRNEWASIDEAYDAYTSKRPLNVMTAESLRAYVEYGLRDRGDGVWELKCAPAVEAAVYAMAPHNGAWEHLPRIESSVLVACGEASRDIAPPLATRVSPTGSRTARSDPACVATSARKRTPHRAADVDPRLRQRMTRATRPAGS